MYNFSFGKENTKNYDNDGCSSRYIAYKVKKCNVNKYSLINSDIYYESNIIEKYGKISGKLM